MTSWIGKLFRRRTAVEKSRTNPVLEAAVLQSAAVYDRIPLHEFISEQRRSELARELFLEVNRVCNSTDPVSVCREHFAAAMLELASYQVLVIPPEPEEDIFGLRHQPGITGELKAHLVALRDTNDDLRSATFADADLDDFDHLWETVQRRFWETWWLLETLNAIRTELGDSVAGCDWHDPFLHAACVNAEHVYRWNLDMPPAFEEPVAREASTAYSVFTDIVLSGARDPAAEWRDYYRDTGIPMPDFGR